MSSTPAVLAAYQQMGRPYDEAIADPDRRRIDGIALASIGITGVATGRTVLVFDRSVISIHVAGWADAAEVRYEDVTALHLDGRRAFADRSHQERPSTAKTSADRAQQLEVDLLASAMDALLDRGDARPVTLVSMVWNGGGIVVATTATSPKQTAVRLAPIIARLPEAVALDVTVPPRPSQAASPPDHHPEAPARPVPVAPAAKRGDRGPSVPDVAGQIAELAQLHGHGLLTDEEFAAAKRRVLA